MNTPAHIVINLLCLGRRDTTQVLVPIVIGSILPDAPMFVFYFTEKVLRSTPEAVIWSTAYYQEHWQNFIDLFNSLPLIGLGLLITGWVGSKAGMLLFGSMMLHVFEDLPLHHEDAHRHFFPFSDWRFFSPVSYWDPDHYGTLVTQLEILTVIASCVILFFFYRSLAGKTSISLIGLCYLAYFIYVFTVWA